MKRRDFLKSPTAGRESVTERNQAAAVLVALLLGLFGAGSTATAQAQSLGTATSSPATSSPAASLGQGNRQRFEWLRIIAFTDAPVAGAEVRVSVYGLPLVQVPAATNQYGVFPVAVRSHPSLLLCRFVRGCRVSISGGTTNGEPFFGHLMAEVALTDPAHQIVVVNPVTTLVSRLLDARPHLQLEAAEARVRRFLGLPADYSLGLALRQSSGYVSRYFSPVAFLTEAQAAGGLDAFAHLLLQELASDSATHPFRPPPLLGSTQSTATSIVQTGIEAGVLDYAGANNAANLTGWAMALSGLSSGGSSADIDALLNALADLQSSIDALSTQVAQLSNLVQSTATQTQYNTIVVPAQTLEIQVNGVESDLSYFAQACPPLPAGSTPTPDAFCSNQKSSVTTELNDVTIQQAYVTLQGYVGDNPTIGFRGMLHLYSLWLAQSKPFFRPADSTQMQDLYDYWDAALTQAANLKVELLHENGAQHNAGGQKQLTDFLGNPTLSPPTTGTFQANEAANLKLTFPPVPAGTVVSTQDHTMWSLLPWQNYNDQQGFSHSHVAAGCGTYGNGQVNLSQYIDRGYAGFNNWSVSPQSKAQWDAAVKLAPPLSSGTDWQDWLIAQTNTTSNESPASAGFFNIVQNCHVSTVWTNTVDHISSNLYYWDVIVLDKNTFITQDNAKNFIWPTRTLASGEQYFWYN